MSAEMKLEQEALAEAFRVLDQYNPDAVSVTVLSIAIRTYLSASQPSRDAVIEECAKVAEAEHGNKPAPNYDPNHMWDAASDRIAAALRAMTKLSGPEAKFAALAVPIGVLLTAVYFVGKHFGWWM